MRQICVISEQSWWRSAGFELSSKAYLLFSVFPQLPAHHHPLWPLWLYQSRVNSQGMSILALLQLLLSWFLTPCFSQNTQKLPSALLIWSHWDNECQPHSGLTRSLVLDLGASTWHWRSPSSIPLSFREGKGDEMGEPLLEPDAALTELLLL